MKSFAKINWSLRIIGKRADGFHDLETVFQTISLHDELTFRDSDRMSLTCDDPTIPTDDTNLVLRAARAVSAPPTAIELKKRIPTGGGLGGGSSNAATTLLALGAERDDLAGIALNLGSDVPFFLLGGTAYATGRGEVLTPIAPMNGIPLLLLLPEARVLTKDAFARITRYSQTLGIDAYTRGFEVFTNDFEEPVFAMLPRLRELKERLYAAGAQFAAMSGSGSTLFGAFATKAARDAAATLFTDVRAEKAETREGFGVR
ncbi:MAG TPA: 4-(cytidine 5'-diphospho)-2-C-methyl-D-erythritol kinase [Thermoanaerobaculia bacterium]|nr:4-(cytidine 5'-diphospho)-2-C-methyl-D-erythritol kinase [Thermoanaerobaculia bacterium]